jgi:hypothetical protein
MGDLGRGAQRRENRERFQDADQRVLPALRRDPPSTA